MKIKSRTSSIAPARSRSQAFRKRSPSMQSSRGLLRELQRLAQHKKKAYHRIRQVYKLRQQKLKQLNQIILRNQNEHKEKAKKKLQRHKRRIHNLFEKMKTEMRYELAKDHKTLTEQKKKRNLLLKKLEKLKRQTKTMPKSWKMFKGHIKRYELAFSGLLPIEQALNNIPNRTNKSRLPSDSILSPKSLECVQNIIQNQALRKGSRLVELGPYRVPSKETVLLNAPFLQGPYTPPLKSKTPSYGKSKTIQGFYDAQTLSDLGRPVSKINNIHSIMERMHKNISFNKRKTREKIKQVVDSSTRDKRLVRRYPLDLSSSESDHHRPTKVSIKTRVLENEQIAPTMLKEMERSKEMRSTISNLRKGLRSDFRMMRQLETSLKTILKGVEKKLIETTSKGTKGRPKPKTPEPRNTPYRNRQSPQSRTSSRGPSRAGSIITTRKIPRSENKSKRHHKVGKNQIREKKKLMKPSPSRSTKIKSRSKETVEANIKKMNSHSNEKPAKASKKKDAISQLNSKNHLEVHTKKRKLSAKNKEPRKKKHQYAKVVPRKKNTTIKPSSETISSNEMRQSLRNATKKRLRESRFKMSHTNMKSRSRILGSASHKAPKANESTTLSMKAAINMVELFKLKQKMGAKFTRSMLSFISDATRRSSTGREEDNGGLVDFNDLQMPESKRGRRNLKISEDTIFKSPSHSDEEVVPPDVDPNWLIDLDPIHKIPSSHHHQTTGIVPRVTGHKSSPGNVESSKAPHRRLTVDLQSGALDNQLESLAGSKTADFKKVYQLLMQDKLPNGESDLKLLNKYQDDYQEMLEKLHDKRLKDCTTPYDKVLADADFEGTRRQMSSRLQFIQHNMPTLEESMFRSDSDASELAIPGSMYDIEALRTKFYKFFNSQAKTSFQLELDRRHKLLRKEQLERRRIRREIIRTRERSRSQSQRRVRLGLHYSQPRLTSRQRKVEEMIRAEAVEKVSSKCSICGLSHCGSYSDINDSMDIVSPPKSFSDVCTTLKFL